MDQRIFTFISHKYTCDATQPMWHKGPCDCGLYDLFDDLLKTGLGKMEIFPAVAIQINKCLQTLYSINKESPGLIEDWEESRTNKALRIGAASGYKKVLLPASLYTCGICKNPTAEKQPDFQGWDGHCHVCGMISQEMVGELVFSRVK